MRSVIMLFAAIIVVAVPTAAAASSMGEAAGVARSQSPGGVAEEEGVVAGGLVIEVPGGRLCPVPGPHSFDDTWGEARAWGRSHKGTDIHTDFGAPLVAMEDGMVVQADWHWAGGRGLYIEGQSGDVYYYAHLDGYGPGITTGAKVSAGQLVGWAGMSGNAETPHLHLGWIPGGGTLDDLANPYPLLVALCGSGIESARLEAPPLAPPRV